MIWTRRNLLLGLAASALPLAPRRTVAFHYEAVFAPDAVEWYTRFDTLVTGAVLAPAQTEKLRRKTAKLVAYEWSSGFYPGDSSSVDPGWEATLRRNAQAWLISPDPVGGAAAAAGRTALWYDFGDAGLIAARAGYLAEVLRRSSYDGFFFDTPGFEQVPEPMRATFEKRHPGVDYNQVQGAFFGALRRRIGASKIIFLNQGYRHAGHMLPHADLDLTESYFTALDGAGTRFRKWHDPALPWEAIRTPMEQLVAPAAAKFPRVRFVHANYAGGGAATAHRAARFAWACAKLWNHESYLMAPGVWANERDGIYFTETGAPTSSGYQESGAVAWRAFEKGVVAVNTGTAPAKIPELGLTLSEPQQGYFFSR